MKLALKTSLLGLALAFTSTATAQDIVIELTPGLYQFDTKIFVNGSLDRQEDIYEYCIPEERATTSLNQKLADFAEGGECSFSNITKSSHTATGNYSCYSPDLGFTVNGILKGNYSPKHYEVTGTARLPFGEVRVMTRAEWLGACPPGWTPPPGISHE